jgi:hypothetical protein
MTYQYSKEENEIVNFVLETTKNLVMTSFDIKDRINKKINFINFKHNIYGINIYRNCHHSDTDYNSYTEDYFISFVGTVKDKKIKSQFYLEWKDNILCGELIPSNTRYDPNTNTFYNRNIKIKLID